MQLYDIALWVLLYWWIIINVYLVLLQTVLFNKYVFVEKCTLSNLTLKLLLILTIVRRSLITLDNLVMQMPFGFEWIFIIVIIVVLFFGVKKIPELAKSFGKATAEFEKAKIEAKRDLEKYKKENTDIEREKLESIAETLRIDYTDKNDEALKKAIENEINKNKNT
jgi:sec-independent protein translocase protein TatA